MERHIDKTIVPCTEVIGQEDKVGGILARGNADVWNAKANGEMNHFSHSHIMDIKSANDKVASSQLNLANEGLQAPLRNGAARMIHANFPPTSPFFPTAAIRDIPPLNTGHLGSNHLFYGNGIMGASGSILKPSQAELNKLDVQLSEVCQRRFVMFDRSGSKRRMIFHPAMMSEFSALIPSSLQANEMFNLEPLPEKGRGGSGRETDFVRSSFCACIAPPGMPSPYYDSHIIPTSATMDSLSSASDNCDNPLVADAQKNVGADMEMNYGVGSSELSCFSHENTEDLEALLSSDEDEVSSTGHSPSDLTRNNSLTACPINNEGYNISFTKKRKREFEARMDDDTCSTATSGNKIGKDLSFRVGDADSNLAHFKEGLAFNEAALLKPLGYDSTTLDMFFPDEMSATSSANNKKWRSKFQSSQQQHSELPAELSRKEKIKSILRLLRGIIPGGESMDTAFVLDEAIQYVRTLQSEVQKLQARKRGS